MGGRFCFARGLNIGVARQSAASNAHFRATYYFAWRAVVITGGHVSDVKGLHAGHGRRAWA